MIIALSPFINPNERSSTLSDYELIMVIISIAMLVIAAVDKFKDKK